MTTDLFCRTRPANPSTAPLPRPQPLRRPDGTHRVVVTGIGLATPLGDSLAGFSQRLFAGGNPAELVHTRFAAPVPGMRVHGELGAQLSRTEFKLGDRVVHLALLAGERALRDAGWSAEHADPRWHGCGVFVGNSAGPTEAVSRSYEDLHAQGRVSPSTLLRCLPGGAAASLAMRHRLHGPSHTITAACASSAIAIGEGLRAIRHGYVDRVLVGGTEAPFSDGMVKAWEAMRLLAPGTGDPTLACRPFDSQRCGLVLGEGAAFFVLESAVGAAMRGARVHAVLRGFGATSDAHHWTEPCAAGQVRAMQAALADAGVRPADVQLVNAYGPGTPLGDSVEAQSIARVFGTGRAAPWVHSTKSLHGHTLGASGAVELAAVIASLQAGSIPATRNLERPDDLPLNLVYREPRALPRPALVLSNSFGFGGSNACLVVAAH